MVNRQLQGFGFGESVNGAKGHREDDGFTLHGHVIIELFGPDGELKQREEFDNTICTAGKNQVLLASAATYLNQFKYLAIGTSSTAPAITDTTLGAEVARSSAITPTNPSANTLQFVNTFAAGTGTGAIVEAGLLDAASSGNLFSHVTFSVINKGASDTLAITYQIT